MIVLDASAAVELITCGPPAEAIRRRLETEDEPLLVPELLDLEVLSAIRGLAAGHRIDQHFARRCIAELNMLDLKRFPHAPLLDRIWELRHNFTAYDAAYIALAEATGAVLFTCDPKLRRGHKAKVVVFAPLPN